MKRGMFILLFICLLAGSISAMTVDLVSPGDATVFTNTDEASLTCKGTITGDETLSNLTLYFINNESTAWHAEQTETSIESGANKIFTVSSLVNATYTWNCLAVSNNSEETWSGSNKTFIVTFTESDPNQAPQLTQNIPDMVWEEDVVNTSLDISIYFNDSDGDTMTFAVAESPSGISVSIASDGSVTFTPEGNWTGNTSVMFSASDASSTTNSNPLSINVTPINDPPYLREEIPNKTWYKDSNDKIDLDDYFSDADGSDLTYGYVFVSSGERINITIESDGDAVFRPDSGWTGTETVKFTAYDDENVSVTSNEVMLTVTESGTGNTAPSIDTALPESNPSISLGETQTFSITKSDAENSTLDVTWYIDNILKSGETSDSFTFKPLTIGNYSIKVSVSDGEYSDAHTWTLKVQSADAQTTTASGTETEPASSETSACGDGECSENETQTGCCKDCGCPDKFTCDSETNKCIRKKGTSNTFLIAIVLFFFIGGAVGGVYYYRKQREKDIFGLSDVPFKIPPKEGGAEKKEVKKPALKKTTKILKKHKTTNQVLLKNYIIYNLKKGKSFDQIKKELIKVGWSEDQISDANAAARLEEAFS